MFRQWTKIKNDPMKKYTDPEPAGQKYTIHQIRILNTVTYVYGSLQSEIFRSSVNNLLMYNLNVMVS